ncbi:hypothetical protein ACPPVO_26495 [Dactylosporangium sp. McL0621]|uniref:hypothetical protein n=1 Tax=Dactylosporangium sp. McL0621 TaxID=3415678 RepID=UPI003CF2E094
MVLHLSGAGPALGRGGWERVAAFALPVWTAAAGLGTLGSGAARMHPNGPLRPKGAAGAD